MLVAEYLDFDVARIDDEFLDEDAIVAEGRRSLGTRAGKTLDDFVGLIGDAHALAAAAGRGLQHDGIADRVGDPDRLLAVLDDAEMARHDADLGGRGEFLGFDLVAHRLDGARIGADEDDVFGRERLGEGGALGQEAIARMHGLGAGLLASGDDLVDQQIGLRGRRRTETDGLIGHLDMQSVGVGVRIDGDGGDPQAAGCLDDAAGDLATIGDENFTKHASPDTCERRAPFPKLEQRARREWSFSFWLRSVLRDGSPEHYPRCRIPSLHPPT